MNYTINKIAEITNGKLFGKDCTVNGVITDSRSIITTPQEKMFVALRGEHRSGEEYISSASRAGIKVFLVNSLPLDWEELGSFIVVEDTLFALQELAKYHRKQYRGEVVAITGSNGKTIVKEWFAQLWDQTKYGKLTRSPRSYNSQLGVALSLLQIQGDERVVVIEAGISKCGEMPRLKEIIEPTLGVITNIGDAHSENFNSWDEKLEEKLKLFGGCSSENIIRGDLQQSNSIEEHNEWLVNAIYSKLEVAPLKEQTLQPLSLRLEVQQGLHNSTIINDSYSNDLTSLRAALEFARRSAKSEVLNLIITDIEQSDMPSQELYSEVYNLIKEYRIQKVIAIGNQIRQLSSCGLNEIVQCSFYESTKDYLFDLNSLEFENSTLLIKGARSFKTEEISSRLEERTHTTTLEINLSKLIENLKIHQAVIPSKCKTIAMVKASSYGLGSLQIAKTLLEAGVSHLAVAFGDEGIALRKAGITAPIIALNADPGALRMMIEYNIEPEIYSFDSLEGYTKELKKAGIIDAPIHLKVDTGMHRLGFQMEEIEELCRVLNSNSNVRVATILSHLATADDPEEDEYTKYQIGLFKEMTTAIINSIGYTPKLSLANSAGTLRFPEAHHDLVRIGIGLYNNIATLATKITQIKRIKKGETIGYNRREVVKNDMLIAIIPIGYADGLDRGLSRRVGKVSIGGKLCDIIGNICMDMTIVDITELEGRVKPGDKVEIIGGNAMSETEVASLLDTISYEMLTSISTRIKRIYTW